MVKLKLSLLNRLMESVNEQRRDKGQKTHVGGNEIKQITLLIGPFVTNNYGSIADVEDLVQEGLATFFQKLLDEQFVLRSNVVQYITGICKKKWLQELQRRSKEPTSGVLVEDIELNIEWCQNENHLEECMIDIMMQNISKLSDKCQKVFDMRMEGSSCEQIAEIMNLKNTQSVKDKHYRCKKRLQDLIRQDPNYDALMNER